jgi:methyl-accepting chemotaxis protein
LIEEVVMIRSSLFAALVALAALSASSLPCIAHAEPEFTLDARVTLDSLRATIDARLEGISTATRLLAATEEARSGDWARIRGPLGTLVTSLPEEAAIWYAKSDGSLFTVEKGATGDNLRDRAYFPSLQAGRDVVGALVISKSTGKRAVIVASPVVADGRVTGAVGVSVDAAMLAASIDRAIRFPPDVVFYTLDDRGQTALHRAGELIFAFPSDVGSASLADAVKTMLSQPEGVVHYNYAGSDRTAVFTRSPLTGWTYVLGKAHPAR